jgi:hypothetical protein
MGEMVPRCGAGGLIKIIVRESLKSQGVMFVQVSMSSQRRVRESSLCPSAYPCEEKLQLKRITIKECTVFRVLCPCPRGASWLRPAWVR